MKNSKGMLLFISGTFVGAILFYALISIMDNEDVHYQVHVQDKTESNGNHDYYMPYIPESRIKEPTSLADSKQVDNGNKRLTETETEKETLNVDKESLLSMFEDEEDKRVRLEYEQALYDSRYDQTWKDDIYYEAYTELERSELSEKATISSYDCESKSCSLVITLNEGDKNYMNNISDYMRSIKDSPAILKSGMKRNVFLETINPKANPPIVKIRIGE